MQRVLITGGARRIGREIARALAAQNTAAQSQIALAIHYHRASAEAQSLSAELAAQHVPHCLLQADLADAAAVEALIPRAAKNLGGPLTGLINNAAHFTRDTLATLSPENFARHQQVNLAAPLQLMRAFRAQCDAARANTILNLTDGLYGWSVGPNFLSYALSKLSLEEATRMLAPTLASDRVPIRMHALTLGATLENTADDPALFAKLHAASPDGAHGSLAALCDAVLTCLQHPTPPPPTVIALNGGMVKPW